MCFWQAVKITVCWYVQIARARIMIYITYIKYNILILIESIRVLVFFMSHTNLSRWEDDKHSKVVDHWLLAVGWFYTSCWIQFSICPRWRVGYVHQNARWDPELNYSPSLIENIFIFFVWGMVRMTLCKAIDTTCHVICITFNLLTFNLPGTGGMSLATITEQRICHAFVPSLLMTGRNVSWGY